MAKLERWQKNYGNKWARRKGKKQKVIGDIYYAKNTDKILYMIRPLNAYDNSKKPSHD